jgi:tripartite-type tricarboxylate transporter receptor subunit TctC
MPAKHAAPQAARKRVPSRSPVRLLNHIAVARRLSRAYSSSLVLLLCAALPAVAAGFPDRPVSLVVPYSAGGSSDIVARLLSLRLADLWGQPVLVENVPGTASVHGTRQVAKAPPDGHTLLAGSAALAINEALSRTLPYHALHDFAPISLVARQHVALVVNAGASFQGVAQLLEAARVRPGSVSYGSPGPGTIYHLAGELFSVVTGANVANVTYNGANQTIRELLAGHVSCAMVALPSAMPYVQAGRLRVLGVAGSQRAQALPEVPAIGETVQGYEVNNWTGILAPYGATVALVRKINADLNTVISRANFKAQLASLGYDADASTPGEFQNLLAADIERYARIVAAAGLQTGSR